MLGLFLPTHQWCSTVRSQMREHVSPLTEQADLLQSNEMDPSTFLFDWTTVWTIKCLSMHMTAPVSKWRCVTNTASWAEPRWSLPGSLHYPLVFVLIAWRLPLIQYNRLHLWGPQWASFHCFNLLTNQSRLLAHLCVAEATQDMFLLQVATFWTWLDVRLGAGERERGRVKTVVQDNTEMINVHKYWFVPKSFSCSVRKQLLCALLWSIRLVLM